MQQIRSALARRGLSLRAAARLAGISHSSLSRVLRQQARATAGLLRSLAPILGLPAEDLLRAAGLPGPHPRLPPPGQPWDLLGALGLDVPPPELLEHVRQQLVHLREYAGTAEAVALVREALPRKVESLGARGPLIDRLLALARLYLEEPDAPPAARASAGSAVLYFVLAVDAIDDFVWPIGYIDDALAVALAEADVRAALDGPGP